MEKNFVTHHMEINDVLEGGIPEWAMPKSFKEGQLTNNYYKGVSNV